MENKQKKKSINTVIYLLLSAMVAGIVLISVFTVASRRGQGGQGDTSITSDSDTTASDTSDATKDTSEKTNTDTSAPPVTDDKKPPETTEDKKTNAPLDDNEKPTSADIRYFVIPTVGSVSKEFQIDVPVYSITMNDYRAHTGVDIAASMGDAVVASSAGIVSKIWDDPMMGTSIAIDHGDNIYTTYKNLAAGSTGSLNVGDRVVMGQTIGAVGESALIEIAEVPHVHVEMTVDGNFVNPLEYMSVSENLDSSYED